MSDEEHSFDLDEESGEDFSASEDEWKPGKDDRISEAESESGDAAESDDSDSDHTKNKGNANHKSLSGDSKKKVRNISKARKMNSLSKRRSGTSARLRMQSRQIPPSKMRTTISDKVSDILSSSRFKQRHKMPSTSNAAKIFSTSDSGSSDEAGLVDPEHFDYNQTFPGFNQSRQQPSIATKMHPPKFDCNAGVSLSASSDDDANGGSFVDLLNEELLPAESVVSDAAYNDFRHLQEFNQNLESAKRKLGKLREQEATTAKTADEMDVSKLLSMGESTASHTSPTSSDKKRKHRRVQVSDDSEWENVTDDNDDQQNVDEIKDIQITVGHAVSRHIGRSQQKANDIEACMKRRLNRDIKEQQMYLHKASVLCWIAHGNHINRILNDLTLMEICLKQLPSKNAYPKGDTDIKYFSMFTDWFHQLFELKSDKLYSGLKGITKKRVSLAIQLQTKKVISKCDYVQLFVTMLRAIGIQCRLVINLAVPSLKPPQNELFVISSKPKESNTKEKDNDSGTSRPNPTKHADSKVVSSRKSKRRDRDISIKGDMSLPKKLKVSVEKAGQSTREHHKSSRKAVQLSKSKHHSSMKQCTSPEKNTDTSQSCGSCKSLKVSLARLSKKTLDRKTDNSLLQVQRHHVTSSDRMRGQRESSNNNHQSSKGNEIVKTTFDKRQQHIKSSVAKHDVDKEHEIGDKTDDTNNIQIGKSYISKASKKKAGEPVGCISKASPPKMPKTTETNLVPSLRKSRPRSKTIASSTFEEKSASSVFTAKNINTDSDSPQPIKKSRIRLKLPQMDGSNDVIRRKPRATAVEQSDESSGESSSGSDFQPASPKRYRSKVNLDRSKSKSRSMVNKSLTNKKKSVDRRIFSSDDEAAPANNTNRMDFWIESYAEKEKKWIVIDPVKKQVDCVDFVRKHCSKPIVYVLAWNNDQTIRDVTPRYASNFHTTTRKQRAEQQWIDETFDGHLEHRNPRIIIEDIEFSKLNMDTPMPTSISEFKNHPLYALERHLLKFEAIYPSNSLTLGYIRKEPIYSRDCVHTLHSREIWVKQARTVKLGEHPYKIVKARPKWNRALNQMEEAKPLEIFGFWQTEPYQPPVAENGIVPRNAYGNVELFKPEMLPIGTRHLQLPMLNRVCKKMGIDCAQAVIGFDFHGGSSHPTFDGFVVCEEFVDAVIEQWEIEQEEQTRKELEKRETRVYGNWKKLIKGLFIRERLKRKFNFGHKADGPKKIKEKA